MTIDGDLKDDTVCTTDNHTDEIPERFEFVFNPRQFDAEKTSHDFVYDFQNKTRSFTLLESLRQFSEIWTKELLSLKLGDKESTRVFKLVGDLIGQIHTVNSDLLAEPNNDMSAQYIVNTTNNLVQSELSLYNTAYKHRKKIGANALYVHPVEKAVGTRYEMKMNKARRIAVPKLIQSTMQFVPITESLQSIFAVKDFLQIYLKYNAERHVCMEGQYKEFCCGSVHKKNELFSSDKYAIQIQIYTDDFEPCNPLQSKAGVHKLTAVYFAIRNIPPNMRSKLNSIHLVCLCHSDDINKSTQADFNNVWEIIVADLSRLETEGISVGSMTLRGSICWPSFDNLGANVSLGFAGSFSAVYYCRFCECNSIECSALTREVESKIRTKENYASRLATIQSLENIDYAKTFGVKRHCILNELIFFHTMENISVDILHDLYEGAMPLLIGYIIEFLLSCKMVKKSDIIQMVENFDYGEKNKKNIPSMLAMTRKNLGQNGSQSKCLFSHFPLIFYRFKNDEKVLRVWNSMESLATISQIVHSNEISSENLHELEESVSTLLSSIKSNFHVKLIPKLHNLTHYARVIKSMGPVVHQNTIRFEGKHKTLKQIINRMHNFQNPCKTIAVRHQQHISISDFGISDLVSYGSKQPLKISNCIEDENLFTIVNSYDNTIYETKYLCINDFQYRKHSLVICDALFQIKNILIINGEFYFYCEEYELKEFNSFLHAYKIVLQQPLKQSLLELKSLTVKKPFELKIVSGENFVFAETLDIRKCL